MSEPKSEHKSESAVSDLCEQCAALSPPGRPPRGWTSPLPGGRPLELHTQLWQSPNFCQGGFGSPRGPAGRGPRRRAAGGRRRGGGLPWLPCRRRRSRSAGWPSASSTPTVRASSLSLSLGHLGMPASQPRGRPRAGAGRGGPGLRGGGFLRDGRPLTLPAPPRRPPAGARRAPGPARRARPFSSGREGRTGVGGGTHLGQGARRRGPGGSQGAAMRPTRREEGAGGPLDDHNPRTHRRPTPDPTPTQS